MSVYTELKRTALPCIEAYHDDLVVHDRRFLRENPGVPFLHFTGKSGTHLISLIAAEEYPENRVPYIFGTADKYEILESEMSVVEGMAKRYGRGDLAMYYNGKTLKKISYQDATRIAGDYVERTRMAWRKK